MKTGQLKIAEVALDEREKELDAMGGEHAIRLEELFAACNKVVRAMTAEGAADELARMWEKRGRPVTAGVLKNALADSRGNYFRLEWILYFAAMSSEVRELLIAIGRDDSPKEPREELADLQDDLREQFPKQADAMIRRAKRRRR